MRFCNVISYHNTCQDKILFSFPKNNLRVVFAKSMANLPPGLDSEKMECDILTTFFLLMTLIGLQEDYDLAPYHPLTHSHQQFKVICDLIFVLKSLANVNCFILTRKKIDVLFNC